MIRRMMPKARSHLFFQRAGWILFFCIAAVVISGCRSPTLPKIQKTVSTNALPEAVASTPPKRVFNVPKSQPSTAQKFNPVFWLGNMDDPVPPDWYRPKNKMRKVLWNLRNPLHNFFFYVIGIADKEFEIVGRVPGRISKPGGGWNWTVCKYKWLRLPLISYTRGSFNFYLGWRNRGNLGMKLNFSNR
ncbi:MAG: hypothetical protein ABIQ35_10620 [Verrucomicrobiota bacterium]